MVFTSLMQLVRSRGPDEFWRKRRVLRLAAHYVGRRRNCYSVAVRAVHRALAYATRGRELRRRDAAELWTVRTSAAAEERGCDPHLLYEALDRSGLLLNRKSMAELAAWEPRTFDALAAVALHKREVDGLAESPNSPNRRHNPVRLPVYLKGLLDD